MPPAGQLPLLVERTKTRVSVSIGTTLSMNSSKPVDGTLPMPATITICLEKSTAGGAESVEALRARIQARRQRMGSRTTCLTATSGPSNCE